MEDTNTFRNIITMIILPFNRLRAILKHLNRVDRAFNYLKLILKN